MNDDQRPVSEEELHAFADGLTDGEDHARIESWLAAHPAEAEMVSGWVAQNNALKRIFSPDSTLRPSDMTLLRDTSPQRRPRSVRRAMAAAAAMLIFAAGVATGLYARQTADTLPPYVRTANALPTEARSAFLIYASEVRHPVEVGPDQQQHLAQWLGKRLDYPLNVPDLTKLGFDLVGGRLVPVSGKAGALFMYEDKGGRRLTVLIGRNEDNRDTSFRFASEGTVETFYWIDGPIGYAVTGEISREQLRQIADECYRQFPT